MAVQKNFVVKNGIQVSDNLIFANGNIDRVGIGTTIVNYKLHVYGGIGATTVYVTGVVTATSYYGDGSNLSGIAPLGGAASYSEIIGTAGTITTFNSTNGTITTLNSTNGTITNLTGAAGTITTLNSTNGTITNLTGAAGTITTLNSTNGTITNLTGTAATIGNVVTLNSSGINVSGVITATSFRGSAQVGIASSGVYLGLTTQFNFVGLGVTVNTQYDAISGITTLTFSGGSGGGGGVTPPGGSPGQIQYNNGGVFDGLQYFTTDGLNLNYTSGILTATNFDTTNLTGTAGTFGSNVTLNSSGVLAIGIITARNSATQDSISLNGRAGGTSNFNLSLTPTTLAASRTVTFQDVSGTVYVSGGTDVTLADGGTNASLTASDGGIVYSTASAMAILSGTATAGQILRSGASGAPSWSTATYPATTTINRILYSSAANTIGEITSANTSALVTNSTGVPSFTSGTTANRLLRTDGTTISFAQANLTTDVTGTLASTNGGTAQSTYATGDILYASATDTLSKLPVGTASSVLTVLGGVPVWAAAPGGSITVNDDTSTDATRYLTFTSATSGSVGVASVSSTKLQFNPSTGTLSATVFTSLSDETQKTNIQPIQNAIDTTKQLEGVRFDWKDNQQPSLGLIAQQVEKVIPEVVNTDSNGVKSVNYGSLIGLLVEAIKEQQVRIEELEKKLNA